MELTYKLIVTGVQPGRDTQTIREMLRGLLKGEPKEVEAVLHRVFINEHVVLAENLPRAKADNFYNKLTGNGLACRLEPTQLMLVPVEEEESVGQVYTCPACGHKQPPARNQLDTCEQCGVVGRNYEQFKEYKEALDLERRSLKAKLDKERAEKAEAAREKAERKKEKTQQEMLERVRRQAEKELGISPWHKYKQFFEPRVLLPVVGALSVVAVGVGLLIWQLGTERTTPVAKIERGPKIQVTITPPPGATAMLETAAEKLANAASQGTGSSVNLPEGSRSNASGARAEGPVAGSSAMAASAAAAARSDVGSTAMAGVAGPKTNAAANVGSSADVNAVSSPTKEMGAKMASLKDVDPPAAKPGASGADASKTAAKPIDSRPLILPDKIALAKPSAERPAASPTPQLLASLAQYQAEAGELTDADLSFDRAIELLGPERGKQSTAALEVLNRRRVETLSVIARQQHQRQDAIAAQTKWYRAINLANTITAPGERALAFSSIGHTLQDATANTYFDRAAENVRAVRDPTARVNVLSAMARDFSNAGRAKQAEELFDQAMTSAKAIADAKQQLAALGAIAKARAESGNTVAATHLLAQIGKESNRGPLPAELEQQRIDIQSAIAHNLVLGGDVPAARTEFAAAIEQIVKLKKPEDRAEAMFYLARHLAKAGDPESAMRIVAEVLERKAQSK